MIRRTILALLLLPAAFAADSVSLVPLYVVAEARSDAPPHWMNAIIDLRPAGDSIRVRWIRVAPLGGFCSQPVTVKLAERNVPKDRLASLLREADPCGIRQRDLDRAYRRLSRPDLLDHPVDFNVVAACSKGERVIRLAQLAGAEDDQLAAKAPRIARLRNLYWEILELAFDDDERSSNKGDEEDLRLQRAGETVVEELRSGAFDRGLTPCEAPGCTPWTWNSILASYQGPTSVAEHVPELLQGLTAPAELRFAEYASPSYPVLARMAKIQGSVRLELTLDRVTGAVTEAVALDGHPLLREAATKAAAEWKVAPQSVTAQRAEVTIEFAIRCPQSGAGN